MARFRQVHSRIIDGQRHVWNTERLWALAAGLVVNAALAAFLTG